MKRFLSIAVAYIRSLSFRTGVVVVAICVVCYGISFAQMLLPISTMAKGVLWFVFFGLAKTCQYTAVLILGKAGIERLRKIFKAYRSDVGSS